ncbi:MAG: hypothetical protein Q9227_006564 [Pyrenula ochraceoflavens]
MADKLPRPTHYVPIQVAAHGRLSASSSTDQNDTTLKFSLTNGHSAASANPTLSQSVMQTTNAFQIDAFKIKTLKKAPRYPPVTKETLSELNLCRIIHNIQVRCDVSFNDDLHLEPTEGKQNNKRRDAEAYWAALTAELQVYRLMALVDQSSETHSAVDETFTPRLPVMFTCLRELLMALVPERDHDAVAEHLDVDFLMQQVLKGVLDIAGLARWLAQLLKHHCAPMRDHLADEMAACIWHGSLLGHPEQITQGLKKLFALLEIMKLDVANNQIRSLRICFIVDTEQFQREYFQRRMQGGSFDTFSARRWYEMKANDLRDSSLFWGLDQKNPEKRAMKGIQPLLYGLIDDLTLLDSLKQYPSTFFYDRGRLMDLRNDLRSLVYLRICRHVLNLVIGGGSDQDWTPPSVCEALQLRIFGMLDSSIRCETEGFSGMTEDTGSMNDDACKIWLSNLDIISLEILRAAFSTWDKKKGSVGTAAGIPAPAFSDKNTIHTLSKLICEPASRQHIISEVRDEIKDFASTQVLRFNKMSAFDIREEQGKRRARRSSETPRFQNLACRQLPCSIPDSEDIAHRLAHLVILNWRVWADLCYLHDSEALPET